MYEFYKNKKVLITGHTGFKGSWLCQILLQFGANVVGYALDPPTQPALFEILNLRDRIKDIRGDIRDYKKLKAVFNSERPEIVIHMAAQPLVRESYNNPLYTYETNVMGTVNVLECIRKTQCVKSFLNVTTDKVYKNNEWVWGYRESDCLDGYDPYSNSKSCSELITHSYQLSFLSEQGVAISTSRSGNVIGGGDFAKDRIIPDCICNLTNHEKIIVRNPGSTRPYQHVLEPLFAYLLIVKKQFEDKMYSGNYNIGPDDCDCLTTGDLVSLFCEKWGQGISWEKRGDGGPHEALFLKLDCSKMKQTFGWCPTWHIDEALDQICEWTKLYQSGGNMIEITKKQIQEFLNGITWRL